VLARRRRCDVAHEAERQHAPEVAPHLVVGGRLRRVHLQLEVHAVEPVETDVAQRELRAAAAGAL
jgi:hypothetical protein